MENHSPYTTPVSWLRPWFWHQSGLHFGFKVFCKGQDLLTVEATAALGVAGEELRRANALRCHPFFQGCVCVISFCMALKGFLRPSEGLKTSLAGFRWKLDVMFLDLWMWLGPPAFWGPGSGWLRGQNRKWISVPFKGNRVNTNKC